MYEGDGVTKYFRWDIFDNESVKKQTAYNVDNKLTKVMGTISFLPVLATALQPFYVCVREHAYMCDCVYRIKMVINYGKPLFWTKSESERMKNKKNFEEAAS